jgi:anti-sigma B factor antagonist
MMDTFRVTSRDFRDSRIFSLSGELDASTCRGLLEQLQGPPGSLVVLDLSELTFMDSSGIGAIHMARRLAIKDGGILVVSRPQPMVHRVLQLTGLDTWIVDWDPDWPDRTD